LNQMNYNERRACLFFQSSGRLRPVHEGKTSCTPKSN
jgi:hypothetical protein